VAGKMLGGTKWYLSAFHHTNVLDTFVSVISPPSGFQKTLLPYSASQPLLTFLIHVKSAFWLVRRFLACQLPLNRLKLLENRYSVFFQND
jgi:hypothetical protein